MTAMMLSFAVSSVILWASRGQGNRTLVTGRRTSSSCDHDGGGSDPLTAAVVRWLWRTTWLTPSTSLTPSREDG